MSQHQIKPADKKNKNLKHNFTTECFSKCIKWKLNITLNSSKIYTGLVKIKF